MPFLILGMLRAIWALRRDSQFVSLGLLTVIALVSGTGFYSLVEGLRFVDALYFSVVTLTTVGYGDFAPETDVGKLFTAVYVLVGIGILLAFVTTLAGKMSQTSPLHFGGRPSPVKGKEKVLVGDSLLGRTPGEERSVEEADDALLVLVGALSDRRGVVDVGEVPKLDRHPRSCGVDPVEVALFRDASAGRDEKERRRCYATDQVD